MLNRIKNYFAFTQKEYNGMLVMGICFFILICIRTFYPYFIPNEKYDFSKFQKEIASLKMAEDSASKSFKDFSSYPKSTEKFIAAKNLKSFDPNGLAENIWKDFGLSEKQIIGIKKYESKGGKFYTKADVKKMYTISDEKYSELEPFIDLPESNYPNKSNYKKYDNENKAFASNSNKYEKKTFEKSTNKIVELNEADSLQLVFVSGIGPSFASRILKYRNKLGGFHSINQLKEVFGMDSLKYESLKPYLKVDISKLKFININTIDNEQLRKHPYFYKISFIILNYRKQHGPFKNKKNLKDIVVINEDLYSKIEPYIIVE